MKDSEFVDIQGLARFGFGHLPACQYLLLRVRDPKAAGQWLATAPVTSAVPHKPPPPQALQVAFTPSGLRALGVPEPVVAGFSSEFLVGMAGDPSRSRRLGDLGTCAPDTWTWGGPKYPVDALAIVMAKSGELDAWKHEVCSGSWAEGFEILDTLLTSDLDGREPFGFIDGISQPEVDWESRREVPEDQLDYTNLVALGEFLLGYGNEYGKYTDRPLLDASASNASVLPQAENIPEKRDLGKNGTYLVLRQLEQDVTGFWEFVKQAAGAPDAAVSLAERMVGRKLEDGSPLVPKSSDAIEGIEEKQGEAENRFTYDGDPNGTGCPFAAHIRRANPRTPDIAGHPTGLISRVWSMLGGGSKLLRDDVIASTRFHRLLRRGREYGQELPPAAALAGQGRPEPRGLHFVCLNANISRQFEFVQNAWIMNGKFNGLPDEPDPLLGQPGGQFSIPREGRCPSRVTGIPQFVTVRGGAYFFLPGLRALRYIATTAGATAD